MSKGQTALGILFFMGVFWVVWIFFVSPLLTVQIDIAMTGPHPPVGLEAFLLTNINLLIGLLSVAVLFWAFRGGR